MLDHMNKAVFNNSNFTQVNTPAVLTPVETSASRSLDSIRKDTTLNGYHPEATTIRVPHLTLDILSCLPAIDNNPLVSSSRSTLSTYGSCSFDLAERLELLPHQSNNLLLHTVEMSLEQVGRYNDHYCGYISHHGLVLIASRYAQRIHKSGTAMLVDSSIGRFKIFEHDHRTYVHFDRAIRAAPTQVTRTLGDTPEFQFDIEQVQNYAKGQYFVRNTFAMKEDPSSWKSLETPLIELAVENVLQDTHCRVFLTPDAIAEWEVIGRFGRDMMSTAKRIFWAIERPEDVRNSLDKILAKGPEWIRGTGINEFTEDSIAESGYFMCLRGSGPTRPIFAEALAPDLVQTLFLNRMGALCNGHAKLRSAAIDHIKMVETSDKRFIDIYNIYKVNPSTSRLEEELGKLLHNPNNICLVLWQGWLGVLASYNSTRVRRHAIEATEEWVQFVLAQDSDLLIGAM